MSHYTRRGAERYMGWCWVDNVVMGGLIGFGVFVVGMIVGVW